MEEKDRANDDVNLQDEAVNDLPVPDAQAQQTQGARAQARAGTRQGTRPS